jgi:hypothetical protein
MLLRPKGTQRSSGDKLIATMIRTKTIAIVIGTTYVNALGWPKAKATANTSRISSVAYAVDDNASEAKTARPVFFVSRS